MTKRRNEPRLKKCDKIGDIRGGVDGDNWKRDVMGRRVGGVELGSMSVTDWTFEGK